MKVSDFMKKSGCDMTVRGYEYLEKAIEIAVENPTMSIGMILTHTAKEKGKTYNCVSKGISRVIADGFPKMDAELKATIFDDKTSVTVGKYLVAVSYAIRSGLI